MYQYVVIVAWPDKNLNTDDVFELKDLKSRI